MLRLCASTVGLVDPDYFCHLLRTLAIVHEWAARLDGPCGQYDFVQTPIRLFRPAHSGGLHLSGFFYWRSSWPI